MITHKHLALPLVILTVAVPVLGAFIFLQTGDGQDASNLSSSVFQVSFERSDQVFEPANTFEIALGDLDGDGDLDAVTANGDRDGTQPTRIFFNDGMGTFTDSGQGLSETFFSRVSLGDVDGNGYTDIVISHVGRANEIWLNDRTGRFTDSGLRMGGDYVSGHGALGDLDSDGDLDLFEAVYVNGSNVVWFNEGEDS